MYKIIPILVLVATAQCQTNKNGDLDSVLSSIFGPPPGPDTNQPQVTTAKTIQDKSHASTIVPPVNTNTNTDEEDLSCKMPDGEEGECVSYYLCNVANNTVITDGVGVIDIRVRDGPCASYIDTCCLVPDKRPPDQPVTPKPKPDEPPREGCGWANPEGADLRTTGEINGETKFGEFPWMVAILKIEPVNENVRDWIDDKIAGKGYDPRTYTY